MKHDSLRAMISSLDDAREEGDSFHMGDAWDVTLHAAHRSGGMQITHVTSVTLHNEHIVVMTSKGSRFVLDVEGVFGFGQEPTKGDRTGRRAGFA